MLRRRKKESSIFGGYLTELLDYLLHLVEHSAEEFLHKILDIESIKRRIKRYVFFSIFTVAAIVMILYGLAEFIASMLPVLGKGISHMLVGFIVLIGVFLYHKSS